MSKFKRSSLWELTQKHGQTNVKLIVSMLKLIGWMSKFKGQVYGDLHGNIDKLMMSMLKLIWWMPKAKGQILPQKHSQSDVIWIVSQKSKNRDIQKVKVFERNTDK